MSCIATQYVEKSGSVRPIKFLFGVFSCLTGEKAIFSTPAVSSFLFPHFLVLLWCGWFHVCLLKCFIDRKRGTNVWLSAEENSFDTHTLIWKEEENGFYHLSLPLIHARGICLTGKWQSIPCALDVLSNVFFQNSKLGIHGKLILSRHALWCPAMFHFG